MRPAGLIVAFVALFVGCGSQQTSNAVADSAAETRAASSSRFAISYGGELVMTGVFDYDDGVGMFGGGGDLPRMVFTKDGSFVGLSPSSAEEGLDVYGAVLRGSGKKWVRVSDNTRSFGFAPPLVGDPNDLLRLLRGAIDVVRLETGVERGAKVTRYKARLDVDRALSEFPEGARDGVRATIRQYWTDEAKRGIPLELSVDGQNRLRTLSFDVPDGERVQLEFFDYGIDAEVDNPTADEVMTNEEFIARAKSLCTKSGYNKDESATAACLVGTMLGSSDVEGGDE